MKITALMNFEQFMDKALPTLPKTSIFRIFPDSRIRTANKRRCCPIEELAFQRGMFLPDETAYEHAERLKLDEKSAHRIACAADFPNHRDRTRLLAALKKNNLLEAA